MTPHPPTPDDFQLLVNVLPEPLRAAVRALPAEETLEVVMDLGRVPEARLTGRSVRLREEPVRAEELAYVLEQVGPPGEDNRAGIERTLHRVSAIRNRQGRVVGLTLRVGRAVYGTIDMLRDLIGSGLNLLLLGRPGVGKTTKLREVARVLADDLRKRVMVVDTSNEIGGDGDIPHPGIGTARRMQVSRPDRQHDVMIEAVENHMPEAIIVDEIGTSAEAAAARTIAERGVQLVATAHGNTLENLVLNPTLSDLVGGVQTVTLSDDEARRRDTQKTVSERKAPPTFDIVVEMVDRDEVLVHRDTAGAVDRLLAGLEVGGERRRQEPDGVRVEELRPTAGVAGAFGSASVARGAGAARATGKARAAGTAGSFGAAGAAGSSGAAGGAGSFGAAGVEGAAGAFSGEAGAGSFAAGATGAAGASGPSRFKTPTVERTSAQASSAFAPAPTRTGPTRIYAHALSQDVLERVLRELRIAARVVSRPEAADLVLTVRSRANDPKMRRTADRTGARVEAVKRNSSSEMRRVLRAYFNLLEGVDEELVRDAVAEAEQAVQRVLNEGVPVPLAPRPPRLRKLQHRLASRHHLEAVSLGTEPARHLVIYPLGAEVDALHEAQVDEGGA
ncbi:R3H domain-containing nucleic acid-binding protein [Myxococcaceae bacterium GXIMD 01537]